MRKSIYELAKKRHLIPPQILCATALGELANEGALNQGNALLAGRIGGQNLALYLKGLAEESGENLPSDIREAAATVIKLINLTDDYIIDEINGILIVGVKTDMCKYCPKGVGGAEISGTVCPFPGVIEGFLTEILGKKVKIVFKTLDNKGLKRTPLVKEEGYCKMEFEIE